MKQEALLAQQECVKGALYLPGGARLGSLTKGRMKGGGGSCCTLLCSRGVTDVRRNVWVG